MPISAMICSHIMLHPMQYVSPVSRIRTHLWDNIKTAASSSARKLSKHAEGCTGCNSITDEEGDCAVPKLVHASLANVSSSIQQLRQLFSGLVSSTKESGKKCCCLGREVVKEGRKEGRMFNGQNCFKKYLHLPRRACFLYPVQCVRLTFQL